MAEDAAAPKRRGGRAGCSEAPAAVLNDVSPAHFYDVHAADTTGGVEDGAGEKKEEDG